MRIPNQQQLQNQSKEEDKTTARLIDICLDFFERTSIHGFSEIKNSPYIVVKILWLLLVLGCLGYSIYVIVTAVQDYLMYDVIAQSKINYVNSGTLALPAVWVCYFGQTTTITFKFQALHFSSDHLIVDYLDMKCVVWNSGIASDGTEIDLVSSKIAGSQLGIEINLSFATLSGDEAFLFIGDNSVRPMFSELYNVRVEKGSHYYISLKKFNYAKLPKPYSKCSDSLTDASSHDSVFYRKVFEAGIKYRQLNCIEFCVFKRISELCDCFYPGLNEDEGGDSCFGDNYLNYRNCLFQENLNSNLTECEPYCPLECDSVVFTNKIQSFVTASTPNQITLKIFYDEMSYTDYYEVPKTTEFDLVSTFGGVFGLFLGFSLLSFVEIVTLIFNIVALLVATKVLKNKVNQQ